MSSRKVYLAVVVMAYLAWSTWFYFDYILGPYKYQEAQRKSIPRGNLSDLYARWLGSRELLLHGRDPYSEEITREIQTGYYGRPLDPSRPNDPEDKQAFAYPIYVAFLLAPSVRLGFGTVQKGFFNLNFALTGFSVLLWLYVFRWRPRPPVTLILLMLSLSSMAAVQGLKVEQISLLVAAMFAVSLAAISRGWLILGGVVLALSTIKPQIALIPVVWLLLWAIRDWRPRQRLAWAFGGTMVFLVLWGQALSPGWLVRFWFAIQDYRHYTHTQSIPSLLSTCIFSTSIPGQIFALSLVAAAAWLCFPLLKQPAKSPEFGECAALVMVLNVLVLPMFAYYNQVLLMPGVILLALHGRALNSGGRWLRVAFGVTVGLFLWPWIINGALVTAIRFLDPARVQPLWSLSFQTAFTFPACLFGLIFMLLLQRLKPAVEREIEAAMPVAGA